MSANSALGDSYYRVCKALHLVTNKAIPCVDNALRVWHSAKQQSLPPCTGNCPDGKKPKSTASCKNCVNWGTAVETVFYQPPTTSPPQSAANKTKQKTQISWSNVSQSLLGKSHVELAKAFILRLPNKTPTVTSGLTARPYSSVSDFDSASVLMIMTRFREFHQGDRHCYDIISKVANIRNDLSHMPQKDDMRLDDSKVDGYFRDMVAFVSCLELLHPQHFTSGQFVRSSLSDIQMEPVTKKMKEDVSLTVSLELHSVSEEVANLKQWLSKQTTAFNSHPPADLSDCQRQLKAEYTINRGGIGFMPGMPHEFPIDDYFVDLTLVEEQHRPTQVQFKFLKGYTDVLTLKDVRGRRIDHVLVRGEAGAGKTTMVDKLAYQWSTEHSEDVSDDTQYQLSRFQLVFALDIRKFEPEKDIEDSIHAQLLPDVPKAAIKSLLLANAGKCLYLLDGFDELKSQQQVHALSSKLLLRNSVVVTTRPDTVEKFCQSFAGYAHVRLDGFSRSSREKFVNNFFATATTEQQISTNKPETLLYKLETSYLNALSIYPLLLAMMCFIWDKTGDIPVRMTVLYNQAVECLALQFYAKTCPIKVLSYQQNEKVNEVLLQLGSTALDGLLLKDKQLIFERDEFKNPGRIQFALNQIGVALVCGCFCACVGLEVGLRVGSLGLGLALTMFAFGLGFSMFSIKINFLVDLIGSALKLGLLTEVKRSRVVVTQYSFYHKTFQEFCAAKYWACLAESDKEKFESYLSHINRANVGNMRYLLRFCCGFSSVAAAIVLRHIISNCDSDWELPVTLLFEAESDSRIQPKLHGILRPLRKLNLGIDLSGELWSILNHYLCCEGDNHGAQIWLTHIEELDLGYRWKDRIDFLTNATKSPSFKLLNLVVLEWSQFNNDTLTVHTTQTISNFLVQQLNLFHLHLKEPIQGHLDDKGNIPSRMNDLLKFLLHHKSNATNAVTYFDSVIPNMTTLILDGPISKYTCDGLLDIIIEAGKRLFILPMRVLTLLHSLSVWQSEDDQDSRIVHKFAEAFSYMPGLTHLRLPGINLTKQSMGVIGPAMSKLSNLQALQLTTSSYPSRFLKQTNLRVGSIRKKVDSLSYSRGISDEGVSLLPLMYVPNLKELNLMGNKIGLQGATALCESLCHVPLLTDLCIDLTDNESVIALSKGLHHTEQLKHLTIGKCLKHVMDDHVFSLKATAAILNKLTSLPNLTYLHMLPKFDFDNPSGLSDIKSNKVKAFLQEWIRCRKIINSDCDFDLAKIREMV